MHSSSPQLCPPQPFSITNLEEGMDLAYESRAPAPQCSGEPGSPQDYPDTSHSSSPPTKQEAPQQGSITSIRASTPDFRFQEEPFHAGTGAGGGTGQSLLEWGFSPFSA